MEAALSTNLVARRNNAPRVRAEAQLRSWLDSGQLRPGDALPSERDLSSQLSANRDAVRWALAMLQDEGRIVPKGPRTRVVAGQTSAPASVSSLMQDVVVIVGTAGDQSPGPADPRDFVWSDAVEDNAKRAAVRSGLHVMLLHPEKFDSVAIDRLSHAHPRGLIIPYLPGIDQSLVNAITKLRDRGMRVVVCGGRPEFAGFDRVRSDHEAGGYELTRWLIAQGRSRIAMFFQHAAETYWVRDRRAGYERAMREAGLTPLPLVHFENGGATLERTAGALAASARQMVGFLIDKLTVEGGPIDALMVESDGLAYPAAMACRLLGRRPGSDIIFAGYDGYGLYSWERQFEPVGPQVSMCKQNETIGQELVQTLLADGNAASPDMPQDRVLQPRLVVLDEAFAGPSPSASVVPAAS